MSDPAKLMFLCGKMAAGKSTSREISPSAAAPSCSFRTNSWRASFRGRSPTLPIFSIALPRLRNALAPHICAILSKGISIVLDFPGNTRAQRAWFREMFDRAHATYELHFVDASDALCKRQLRDRTRHLPPGTPWTTDAEFEAITVYFQPPSDDDGFHVVRHERT